MGKRCQEPGRVSSKYDTEISTLILKQPDTADRRKIRMIEGNAKCCNLKKWPVKELCGRCLSVGGPLPSQGWCSNFVGSESGQKQSVKLLLNMVSNTTQHPPPPLSHTQSVQCIVYCTEKGGGGGEQERRLQGQWLTKLGQKYQHV